MATVSLKNISKSYNETPVLRNINLDIADGEFVVLVGPSGCGKSTLLRMLCGLEDITDGDLLIDGERVNDTPPAQRGTAIVFQSYALYPHMNIYRNMAFGLKVASKKKDEIDKRVRDAARALQIDHLLERLPRELSGGQRQRVAIGRAIVREPKLFLFDEPLSNLDAALRVQTRLEIAKLHQQLKTTMVYVTHDQVEAMTLGDKIVVLHQGDIQQVGTPLELYHHPRNLFVAGFIGSPKMNFLKGKISALDANRLTIALATGETIHAEFKGTPKIDDEVTVGIRAEHLIDNDSRSEKMTGTVSLVEHHGKEDYVYLTLADGSDLVLSRNGVSGIDVGRKLVVSGATNAIHVFDNAGNSLHR
jgi:multiple sugar transport system ATP-binding protein